MTPTEIAFARVRAEEALAQPPKFKRIERPIAIGDRVASFIIPLELLPTSNRTGRVANAAAWMRARLKKNLFAVMWRQCQRFERPLSGRPLVHCVRFSSTEPDAYNDGFKAAIDILCARTDRHPNRLNIIVDDRPACVDVRQWWEHAKRGEGFGLIEVWRGAE